MDSKQCALHSEQYHLLSCDATKARKLTEQLVGVCHVQADQPILFVFECVLLYWPTEETNALLYALNKTFKKCSFLVFDLVKTDDTFAKV